MQGRKPKSTNIVPLTGSRAPRLGAKVLATKLCPRGLDKEERKEWMRVAVMLAEPQVDRLKPHFVDVVMEYVRASLRLRAFRLFFLANVVKLDGLVEDAANNVERVTGEPGLDAEVYVVHGRNGTQLKAHPYVAQMNETWRQWRSLMMELGLSPASERNMMPGQGDLFGDPAESYLGG